MTAGDPLHPDTATDIARDARDLRRGVLVNLLGYLIKVANPVLTWAVIILYGSRDYGFFVAAQATVLVALRVCLVGFDKGILWWTARQQDPSPLKGMGWVVALVSVLSTMGAAIATIFAPVLARWHGDPDAAFGLSLMAVSLLPMALTEILVSAAAGKRRMEATVFVRDGLGTVSLAGFGVAFYYAGLGTAGLPVAFVCAKVLALIGSVVLIRQLGPLALAPAGADPLPRPLVRFALPYWLSEVSSSFLQRMDVLVLAAYTTPETVGIWGAVTQIANTLRQIRQAFDPIAIAIFSEIGARQNAARLRAGFSYATLLVVVTQMPVYTFILLFADRIMGLLGPAYLAGTMAVVILSGCWIVNGAIGMNGHIVNGYGRSDLTLVNVLVTIAVEAGLLVVLIPGYGLSGVAASVALAYTIQCLLAAFEGYWLSGVWPYDRTVFDAIAIGAMASIVSAAVWLVLPDSLANRVLAFAAFMAVYGAGTWVLHRRGILGGGAKMAQRLDSPWRLA